MDPYCGLKNKIMLAPMAGYTDKTMRKLCTDMGAGLTFTEMISAKALSYSSVRTLGYLSFDDFKIGIQLFGSEPDTMAEAAKLITERYGEKIAVFDVNMGCPAPKIFGNGDGCALMKDMRLAGDIVSSMKKKTNIPITVKFRKGWDKDHINAVEFAECLEDSGADAIAVHGRTRDQFYSGKSDRSIIASVKKAVSIPVIGNGDIFTPEDALSLMNETGCDGVMVARGALGNPFIFSMINDLIEKGSYTLPSLEERISLAKRHASMVCADKGEYTGIRELRKHLCFYIKGVKGGARIKEQLVRAESEEQTLEILDSLLK